MIIKIFFRYGFIFLFTSILAINAIAQQLATKIIIAEYDSRGSVYDIAWSYDSKLLAGVDGADSVSIYDISSQNSPLKLDDEIYIVKSIAWRPETYQLLIANMSTRIWDYEENQWLPDFMLPDAIEFNEYSPRGNVDWNSDGSQFTIPLLSCDDYNFSSRVEIWDVETNSGRRIGECIHSILPVVQWHPSDDSVAFIGVGIQEPITIWSVDNVMLHSFEYLTDVFAFEWNQAGDMFAIAITVLAGTGTDTGLYQFLRIYDFDGNIILEIPYYVTHLEWHPSNNYIATGTLEGIIAIWDVSDGSKVLEFHAHDDRISALNWSPDGKMLASGGDDNRLLVWDVSTVGEVDK